MSQTTKKIFLRFLKIGISFLLLYLVFNKVPLSEVWKVIRSSNPLFITLAISSFLVSQVLSSSRLLLYLNAHSFHLSTRSNLVLYLIGMFYNFFIPGGIGGDAYKIYILKKRFNWKTRHLTSAVFFDRVSGLIGIICWFLLILMFIEIDYTKKIIFIFPLALIGLLIFTKVFFNKITPAYKSIYNKTLFYSVVIQGFQITSIFFILKALNIEEFILEYIIVFLISSVMSVVSFAGIGVREYLFMFASKMFNFNTETAISVGLIFTIITAFISLFGLFFEIKKQELFLE